MPLSQPILPSRKRALLRARRRGKVLIEIVRAHYKSVDLQNQAVLSGLLELNQNMKLGGTVLASDVLYLKEQGWIKKKGNRIELRKDDYELIADSWCAEALFRAANLTDEPATFPIVDWRNDCETWLKSKPEIDPARAAEKCDEFLQEFQDAKYITVRDNNRAQFDERRWGKDWFYLEALRNSTLHRPFANRQPPE